jgi:predicted GNAT family N-acyltransferase
MDKPPVSLALHPEYHVEALQTIHDRSSFDCGVPELDEYLHHQAGQDARRKVAAPFVMLNRQNAIVGYYTLSAYAVDGRQLPNATAKRLPRYPLLPATLLGRLALSRQCRGLGLGRLLLMDALLRSWKNTAEVASMAVVVEARDESARAFYQHHEFVTLAEHPNRLFLEMATIDRLFRRP